jgi:uncharacterized membrane protein
MDLATIGYYLGLILMAALYMFAGVSHFTKEKFFLSIVPPFLPNPKAIVQWSGIAEILLGATLLIPATRVWAAWGVIALLIVVYPANIYMLVARIQGKKFRKVPVWTLWVRLALQFGLLYWAYIYTF